MIDCSPDAQYSPRFTRSPTDTRFFCSVWVTDRQSVQVQETGLAGVALLGDDHPDTNQFGLVSEHLDEAGMGNAHEVLIVALARIHFLLPAVILADDERPDLLFVNRSMIRLLAVCRDGPDADVRLIVRCSICLVSFLCRPQVSSVDCLALVVPLVHGFGGRPLTMPGTKPGLFEVIAAKLFIPRSIPARKGQGSLQLVVLAVS